MNESQLLTDAIVGRPPVCMTECENLTKAGFMRFTGDQHNPDWAWNRSEVESLSLESKKYLYEHLTEDRDVRSIDHKELDGGTASSSDGSGLDRWF